MSVIDVLIEKTKLERKESESDQDFIKGLLRALYDLDQDDWNDLPEEGKAWYNDVASLISENEGVDGDVADDQDQQQPAGMTKQFRHQSAGFATVLLETLDFVSAQGKQSRFRATEEGGKDQQNDQQKQLKNHGSSRISRIRITGRGSTYRPSVPYRPGQVQSRVVR